MPGRYPSSFCTKCTDSNGQGSPETSVHRYCLCPLVSLSWEWLKSVLISLDSSLASLSDSDFLSLEFEKGFRENAVIWLLGSYIEIVENEVVIKGNFLSLPSVTGLLKQKKQSARHRALPDLGIISGIDFDAQGVG